MLESLRKRFFHRALKSSSRDLEVSRALIPYNEIETIGILFDASRPGDDVHVLSQADAWRLEGKKVFLLGYFRFKHLELAPHYDHFTKKEVGWNYKPASPAISEFLHKPMDLLVNAWQGDILPMVYISTMAKASMRIGIYGDNSTDYNDLILKVNEGTWDLPAFFKDIKRYLNKLKHV